MRRIILARPHSIAAYCQAYQQRLWQSTDETSQMMVQCADRSYRKALSRRVPTAAALGLLDACPEAAKVVSGNGDTPLDYAAYFLLTEAVVAALISAWPGAVKAVDDGGDTPLHSLAKADCRSLAEQRGHQSTLCYMLVKKGGFTHGHQR